ncbi:methionyl-tRNA formyltransferase [Patescibacteria group bacterium]|nr:methionyl-tRNA formyltransferase [Patescibacteria group bacterium]
MNNKLNFVFWGTPEVASETLEILKKNNYLPSLIITAPDKPKGRKMIITPPPVKIWAEKNNIPYLQPEKLDEEFIYKLKAKSYNLFVVVAYGKIMPEELINLPKFGSLNIHYSLLPKYRGASPVESAILNGETETGVSIQKMEFKMDSGPVLSSEKTQIDPDETAPTLRERLIKIGGKLLVKTLPNFIIGKMKPIPQNDHEATYCKKIKKEDGLIDLNDDPIKNFNKFRAYYNWPRIFFFHRGKRIIIANAKLENNEFKILKVLPEGKKETDYKNFISSSL